MRRIQSTIGAAVLAAGIILLGVAPAQAAAAACEPGYSPCLPVKSDMDCAEVLNLTDGKYVKVTGADRYRLDRDEDGLGCEPSGVEGPGRTTPGENGGDGSEGDDVAGGGRLPVTGPEALTFAIAGGAAAVIGVVLFLAARRRRIRFRA